MSSYYNQNYTKKQIELILNKMKDCVKNNKFTIALNINRQENIDFINKYNLRSDKQKSILLQIEVDDFCHSLQNRKTGFEHEVLYVFIPHVQLLNVNDEEEVVNIYIKFNIIELPSNTNIAVISFHKANKCIDYLFKSYKKTERGSLI